MPRSVLIRRDYRGYTGGHGKFRDYVAHVDAHALWRARVFLTGDSLRTPDNPFLDVAGLTERWEPARADALLLGGMDWQALIGPSDPRQPIINLVQHVRHADADSPLRPFLQRRAIRICNSTRVADALRASGAVNGPLRVIASAVDTAWLAGFDATARRYDVFVDAAKQPLLGQAVADLLQAHGVSLQLHLARTPLPDYLRAMASATVALTLPDPTEGIYLPGLNAMAIGRALVQPDCVGSRDYVVDGINALVPARSPAAMAEAVRAVLADDRSRACMVAAGRLTAKAFDLAVERRQVHALLDELDDLWTF